MTESFVFFAIKNKKGKRGIFSPEIAEIIGAVPP
jgi:hypothetical protein